jgi:hypothetical protein
VKNIIPNFKAMTTPFEISFDFPVALSNFKISLRATVELHHSEPFFVVHDFYQADGLKKAEYHSVLPDHEIKRVNLNSSYTWVHRDSERESLLSLALGAAIEKFLSIEELRSITEKNIITI